MTNAELKQAERGIGVAAMLRATTDLHWTMFHVLTDADRKAFDAYLVGIQHPLAMQAGTWEHRMRQYRHEAC